MHKLEEQQRITTSYYVLLTKAYSSRTELQRLQQRTTSYSRHNATLEGLLKGDQEPCANLYRLQEPYLLHNDQKVELALSQVVRDLSLIQL